MRGTGFNLIELHFESKERMYAKMAELKEKGIGTWEYDEDDAWAQFDISGCAGKDLSELFKDII